MIATGAYLQALRRSWWATLIAAAVAANLGVLLASLTPTQYSTHRLLVTRVEGQGVSETIGSTAGLATSAADSLAYLASTSDFKRAALLEAGIPAAEKSYDAKVAVPDKTAYLEITAVGPSADEATKVADAMQRALESASSVLNMRTAQGPLNTTLSSASPSHASTVASAPPRALYGVLGLVLGAALAYLLALLLSIRSPRIQDERDVTDQGAIYLGRVRMNSTIPVGLQMAQLLRNANAWKGSGQCHVIAVVGLGVPTVDVTVELAKLLGAQGHKTLLVVGGIHEYLERRTATHGSARSADGKGFDSDGNPFAHNVDVVEDLPLERPDANGGLNRTVSVSKLKRYDMVFIDISSQPAAEVEKMAVIDSCDDLVLIARPGSTTTRQLSETLEIVPADKNRGVLLLS